MLSYFLYANQIINYALRSLMKYIFILLIVIPLSAYSQQKIGHVDSQELLGAMPEMESAKTKIDSIGKAYDIELKLLQEKYENAIKAGDEDEAKRMQARLYSFKEVVDSEIEAKSEILFTPIRARLKKAIVEIANEEKYILVLDSKYDAIVLYVKPSNDITADVKKKLGLSN